MDNSNLAVRMKEFYENNKKKSGYFISDNLSLFYYKYISVR